MRTEDAKSTQRHEETRIEGFSSICGVLIVGLFALTFLCQNFLIPSSSMASPLLVGDHVMVERELLAPPTSWAPFIPYRDVHRSDVIVFFKPPAEPSGDHIFLVK